MQTVRGRRAAEVSPPPPGPPSITAESATGAGPTSETLKAAIVPLGHDTTCTFQYVDAADFQVSGYNTATSVPCTPANSTHGSITIGTTITTTGNTNLQAGLVVDESTFVFSVVPPPDGALVSDPVQVTVGAFTVTATVEPAGVPSNFNLIAGLSTGVPIITLPIKIHLENPLLGPSCYLGSDQDPILLNPANTDLSNSAATFENFDPDGTPDPNGPLQRIVITGAVQGDDSFAVPGAQGCGSNGSLDSLVNSLAGLPSPAGSNHLVLDDASSFLAVPNGDGQQFASDWHLAFGP